MKWLSKLLVFDIVDIEYAPEHLGLIKQFKRMSIILSKHFTHDEEVLPVYEEMSTFCESHNESLTIILKMILVSDTHYEII